MGAKTVAGPGEKIALRLIDEQAITFAMAKTAIDGDVLLAAPQKTDAVDDFMKYSTYGKFLNGKMPIIVAASLIFAALLGIASYSYFESVENGLYAAAASLLICASPVLFFIDDLPFYRASKKLFARRSCLAGKMGAQTIENANAVVLNAADIFPSGTVTLHDIKVLNDNDMEDTLIRASVLAESANSPLAPIFKKITKSSNVEKYPDSDTVKYEDRMGISGWVDNRLLFIGNRTLMEAHGIEVPSLEVDKKLLREGYFPVYIATRDKVCALLSVQYAVDSYVQKELWRLTKTGVTVLVNSTDPNLTNQMICDYLELYEDSVFVMATVGTHVFKNTVVKTPSISAPAVYRGSGMHWFLY
jgi:cation transport ATPase